ncbi:hypothetical protein AB205_0095820, partial [Aquarana catesbeiana]
DFESAFQENVSINGLSWHEAPDKDSELRMKDLSATAATVCHHIHETKKEAPAQRKSFTLNFYTDMEIPALRCFYRLARAIGKPENESAAAGS